VSNCPKCGAPAEHEQARFCTECGARMDAPTPVSREAAQVSSGGEASSRPTETASAGPAQQADGQDVYVRTVQAKLADGVLDPNDRADLEQAQANLNLSNDEAATLESKAKDLLMSDDSSQTVAGGETAPITLEINDNHFYGERCAAALEFRLVNQTAATIKDVSFAVTARYLGRIDERRYDLRPGSLRDAHERIQVLPELPGEHVVNLEVRYRVDEEWHKWVSQLSLMVFARNTNPSTVVIDQSLHAGRNIGYGLSISDRFEQDIARGVIRDFNDMISQVYPPTWKPLDLARREARKVPAIGEREARRPWLQKATLVFAEPDVEERRVLLLALGEVRLGRNRGRNDIVLRVLPRSAENDELSCRITASRPHLKIALQADGLFVIDQDTPGGTRLDGHSVRGAARLALRRACELDVAGALRLHLTPLRDDQQPGLLTAEQCECLGPCDAVWRTAERLGLRGLLIERVGNLAREERYLIVYRWIECPNDLGAGFSPSADNSGDAVQRVLRIGGRLWGWTDAGTRRPADSDSEYLAGGRVFPLTPGHRVRGVAADGRVEEWRQFGL
jgi:hypothetical protein